MNTKHTQGPWRMLGGNIYTTGTGGRDWTIPVPLNDANRALVEAAPDMLEALLDALPYVEDVLDNPEQLACFKAGVVQRHAKAIRAAIAKATGVTP